MGKETGSSDEFSDGFDMDRLLELRAEYLEIIEDYYKKRYMSNINNARIIKDAKKLKISLENTPIKDAAAEVLLAKYFRVLKKKLGYQDYVIKKILCKIFTTKDIRDIYVYDDRIVYEIIGEDKPVEEITSSFMEITSSEFQIGENDALLNFLVQSINNSVGALFSGNTRLIELLKLNGSNIEYAVPDLEIYINYSYNDIVNNKTYSEIKLRVNYKKETHYFNLKIKNEYVILNEYYSVCDCLSEKLGTSNQKQ